MACPGVAVSVAWAGPEALAGAEFVSLAWGVTVEALVVSSRPPSSVPPNRVQARAITATTTATTAMMGKEAISGLIRARWAPRRLGSRGTTKRSS